MKKSGLTLIELLAMVVVAAIVFGFGFIVGAEKTKSKFMQELVDRKVAHYETDRYGKVKCLWNTSDVVTVTVTNNLVE